MLICPEGLVERPGLPAIPAGQLTAVRRTLAIAVEEGGDSAGPVTAAISTRARRRYND